MIIAAICWRVQVLQQILKKIAVIDLSQLIQRQFPRQKLTAEKKMQVSLNL